MSNWQLFLGESLSVEDEIFKCSDFFISHVISIINQFSSTPEDQTTLTNDDPTFQMLTAKCSSMVLKFKSPIFSNCWFSTSKLVRMNAVRCLKAIIKELPLQKWLKLVHQQQRNDSISLDNKKQLKQHETGKGKDKLSHKSKNSTVSSSHGSSQGLLGDKVRLTVSFNINF